MTRPNFALIALALAALSAALAAYAAQPGGPAANDFVEYRAAGLLALRGENPYDPSRLLPIELDAGMPPSHDVVMMWNPPWTLPLTLPSAASPARVGQYLWAGVGLLAVGLAVLLVWRCYGGSAGRWGMPLALAFGFYPTTYMAQMGQIGGLMLLGAAGFVAARESGRPVLAGGAAVLLAVKPHLAYLLWLAIALRFWREGRLILGGVLGAALAVLPFAALNPDLFAQYVRAMATQPPEQFISPTIGGIARHLFGGGFWVHFPPMILGVLWLLSRRPWRGDWDWRRETPGLLLASFVTAPYGAWPFDLVLLLVPVVARAAELERPSARAGAASALIAFLAIDAALYLMIGLRVPMQWNVFAAPMILLGCVYAGAARTVTRAEGVSAGHEDLR